MTVIDRFFNWQRSGLNWDAPPYESCSPALMSLQTWLLNKHGGQSLGCHGDRAVRAGTEPSSHAFGAALDWRYENPGPGRRYALDVVLPFVLAHSDELGVQAIHDYAGDRIWRPPGHSGRLVGSDGWKAQNGAGGQMGQSWALWFHFEIHPDDFDDARTVEVKTTITIPITTEDDDMADIKYIATPPKSRPGNPPWLIVSDGATSYAANESVRQAQAKGWQLVEQNDEQYDNLLKSAGLA